MPASRIWWSDWGGAFQPLSFETRSHRGLAINHPDALNAECITIAGSRLPDACRTRALGRTARGGWHVGSRLLLASRSWSDFMASSRSLPPGTTGLMAIQHRCFGGSPTDWKHNPICSESTRFVRQFAVSRTKAAVDMCSGPSLGGAVYEGLVSNRIHTGNRAGKGSFCSSRKRSFLCKDTVPFVAACGNQTNPLPRFR